EALFGLGRVGAAARDTLPAIARAVDDDARAAARSIYFAWWIEAESRAHAHPSHWREPLLDRFRRRWQQQPLGAAERQTIEDAVRSGSRRDILLARLQAGDVARERIELAAALGDWPAMEVMGRPCPPGDPEVFGEDAFKSWAEAMQTQ